MTWVIICVILLAAFGPVLWLVPSRKDRRLTALRARGRAEGLVVELRRLPKPDPSAEERVSAGGQVRKPTIECATYGHAMHSKLRHLPTWRVVRVDPGQPADPISGWRYDQRPTGDGRRYLAQMLLPAAQLLGKLPDDVAGFEVGERMLLVYWLEKSGSSEQTVTDFAALLRAFEVALGALEAEISDAADSDDS